MSAPTHSQVVYGYSDDVVEFVGAISDEVYTYGHPTRVTLYAGEHLIVAAFTITFDPDGTGGWRITDTAAGIGEVAVHPARGEAEDPDRDGCPGYSDKAIVISPAPITSHDMEDAPEDPQ